MEMKNQKLEGIITSLTPLGYDHTKTEVTGLFSSTTEKTPYYDFVIKNGSGKEESIKMPMNISNPFEMKLIEKDLVGEKVIFERKVIRPDVMMVTDKITVKSGIFVGVQYEHSEVY